MFTRKQKKNSGIHGYGTNSLDELVVVPKTDLISNSLLNIASTLLSSSTNHAHKPREKESIE
ncbi:hypothetical protein DERP_003036 [Dermatophagoides pteronyssinus]|uniref:Uncharacterized protein n=1 Tax=Dermatophagoides pteronyssinus TaxID=6956 RepID=A0ABQ8JIF3_DERPT|nr:hypothetical protein DERP_003036 [Dermatophagoides pteronyssinus]